MSESSPSAESSAADAVTSTARVATDRPARYAKQLVSHMGRKVPAVWDADAGVGSLEFAGGAARAALSAEADCLRIDLTAEPEALDRFEDVVGRHLVRFGVRDELVCSWQRADGSAGTEQRFAADAD